MKFSVPFAATLVLASVAQAHVVAVPNNGPADSYFQTSLRIAHGCENSATTVLHVKIPDAVISVHPQAKPGWKVTIVTRQLDMPMAMGHGKMTDHAVSEIIWRGGPLPANQYDDFGLLMKLPDAEGQTLWFPVTQECQTGRIAWVDIPAEGQAWHDVHTPAPFVRITAKSSD